MFARSKMVGYEDVSALPDSCSTAGAAVAPLRQSEAAHFGELQRRVLLVAGQQADYFSIHARWRAVRSGIRDERGWLQPAHGLDRQGRDHVRLFPERQPAHP